MFLKVKQTDLSEKFRFFWLTIVLLILDQLTKIWAKLSLPLYESKPVIGKLLMLTHVQNTGAAFSISLGSAATNRIFFIVVTCLAIVFVVYLLMRSYSKLQRISLCLILAGAIGNLIDRIIYGFVTDFIDADFPNFLMERWPVFNVADSCIVIAIGLLILDMFINKLPEETKSSSGEQPPLL